MKIFTKNLLLKNFWVGIFGLAMGFLEAIVVIYLRDIYYPDGFGFPMSPVSPWMYFLELIREIATILILLSMAILIGKTRIQKTAYFLIAFGTWDILYYVALKVFLGWPPNLLTWDVLFLIPLPWLGPVLAPVIVSLTMIWIGTSILFLEDRNGPVGLIPEEWWVWIGGAALIFISFIWNYSILILKSGFTSKLLTLAQNKEFLNIIYNYVPQSFNWSLFAAGELLVIIGTIHLLIRYRRVIEYTGREIITEINHLRHHFSRLH